MRLEDGWESSPPPCVGGGHVEKERMLKRVRLRDVWGFGEGRWCEDRGVHTKREEEGSRRWDWTERSGADGHEISLFKY